MKQKGKKVKSYSIKEMEDLISEIRKHQNPPMTDEDLSEHMHYNRGYITQTRSRGKVSEGTMIRLKSTLQALQNAMLHSKETPSRKAITNGQLEGVNATHWDRLLTLLENNQVFLQNTWESSLRKLQTGQSLIQAQVRAIHQWDAAMAAKGDQKKEGDFLLQTGKRIDANFAESTQKGIDASDGS